MAFGLSAVERGVSASVAVLKPMFAIAYAAGKEPTAATLRDPYLLGLLVTLIMLEASVATGGKAQSKSGEVVLRAWPLVTGDDGTGIGQLMHDFAMGHDIAFNEGADAAFRLAQLMHGKPKANEFPDVAAAIQTAEQLSANGMLPQPDNERAAMERRLGLPNSQYAGASLVLWQKLFVDRLPVQD